MLKWDDFKYHDLDYVVLKADARADAYEDSCYPCPECMAGTMRPGPWDEYGADRDGRRGIRFRTFQCCNCEYEEDVQGEL